MSTADFRNFICEPDNPRVSRIAGLDARSCAADGRTNPHAQEMFGDWEKLYQEPFAGITSDGSVVKDLYHLGPNGAPTQAIVEAATRLVSMLSPAARAEMCYPVDAREWRVWHNTHWMMYEIGPRLEDVSEDVRDAILDVVRASLDARGYEKSRDIMKVNGFMGELAHAPGVLGEWSYAFSLYGEPSLTEPWGWKLFGHHLAIICFVMDGQLVISPLFLGAEPTLIDSGPNKGIHLFREEERAGFDLMQSLPEVLQRQAVLYEQVIDPAMPPGRLHPADQRHLGGAFQDNRIIGYEGTKVESFSDTQKDQLLDLVEIFLEMLPSGPKAARLDEIKGHLDETYFSWIGPRDINRAFYYRVHSPVVLIEYDEHSGVFLNNPEPDKFHVHTIVRTPNGGDYGFDLLRLHYEQLH